MICKMCHKREESATEEGNPTCKVQIPICKPTKDGYFLSRILINFIDKPTMCLQCKLEFLHSLTDKQLSQKTGTQTTALTEQISRFFDCVGDKSNLMFSPDIKNGE